MSFSKNSQSLTWRTDMQQIWVCSVTEDKFFFKRSLSEQFFFLLGVFKQFGTTWLYLTTITIALSFIVIYMYNVRAKIIKSNGKHCFCHYHKNVINILDFITESYLFYRSETVFIGWNSGKKKIGIATPLYFTVPDSVYRPDLDLTNT